MKIILLSACLLEELQGSVLLEEQVFPSFLGQRNELKACDKHPSAVTLLPHPDLQGQGIEGSVNQHCSQSPGRRVQRFCTGRTLVLIAALSPALFPENLSTERPVSQTGASPSAAA